MTARQFAVTAGIGCAAAALRFFYLFFPGVTVWDFVVFVLAGFVVGRLRFVPRWAAVVLTVLPALCTIVAILDRLGLQKIRSGVGSAHVCALVVLPVATVVGYAVGARTSRQS